MMNSVDFRTVGRTKRMKKRMIFLSLTPSLILIEVSKLSVLSGIPLPCLHSDLPRTFLSQIPRPFVLTSAEICDELSSLRYPFLTSTEVGHEISFLRYSFLSSYLHGSLQWTFISRIQLAYLRFPELSSLSLPIHYLRWDLPWSFLPQILLPYLRWGLPWTFLLSDSPSSVLTSAEICHELRSNENRRTVPAAIVEHLLADLRHLTSGLNDGWHQVEISLTQTSLLSVHSFRRRRRTVGGLVPEVVSTFGDGPATSK